MLAPLEPRLVKRVAAKMKRSMATGIDALPPVAMSWLSDEFLHALSTFLAMVEDLGVWPSQISTLIICLIPKVSGGRRPIGLLATLVKVWELARKQQVIEWRKASGRQYDWICQRKDRKGQRGSKQC